MNKKEKIFIVANWKMNPSVLCDAKKLYGVIRTRANRMHSVQTVVCAPYIYLSELQKISKGAGCIVGAQDAFYEKSGAYTGEISANMLKEMKVPYVIIGHSERRAMGDTEKIVSQKVSSALKEKLNVILCVGEKKRDEAGYLHILRKEIQESLRGVSRAHLAKLIIAYEPIWAVGKGAKADTPQDTQETILFIRKVLAEEFDKKIAMAVPILYGGSVDDKNAQKFLKDAGVQGLLIGRAGLNLKQFGEILKIANSI